MFGGGFDSDPFSRMDEMMGGSMFGDGFFGGGRGGDRRGPRRGGEVGLGSMETMMNQMLSGAMMPSMMSGGAFGDGFGDGQGGAFFSSSSTMSFSSADGKTRQYSSQTTSHRGGPSGHRVSETKSQYRDSSGIERAAWERSLNDRARMTIKERNRNSGNGVSTRERYHNLDEGDADGFDRDFGHAAQHVRQLQQRAGHPLGLAGPSSGRSGSRRMMLPSSRDQPSSHRGLPRQNAEFLPSGRDSRGGRSRGGEFDRHTPSSRRSRASSRGSTATWQDNHLGNID